VIERTASQNARRSITKGKNFEREVAKAFRALFSEPEQVKRGFQSRGGGREEADVVMPIFHPECKVGAAPNIRAAYAQATADSEGKGKIPIVVSKRDGEKPLVTISLDDFLEVAKPYIEGE
jgi:hypothetical protein